ncbi:hypothetical protein ACQEVF_59550 [Nonomuraea polychroma]|uniref:hypothetical protein n=1 Tax=Nonomuraea polychroma TaxID=46176 RepID=UPI003D90BE20
MIVTYRPEDGNEPQTWEFDPRKIRASRAEMIEKRAGENWETWLMQVQQGNMRARRVLLWHLMSIPHPGMRYEDTPDFYAGELEVQHTAAELGEMKDRILKAGLPEDQVAQVLMVIDMEMAQAPDADKTITGKVLSKSGASATRSRSARSSESAHGSSESA